MQTMTVGPAQGDLLLLTGVEGKAARLGHRLTLIVTAWECVTTFEGDEPVHVSFTAQLASLQVVKGEGGAKSLSDKDKRTIIESTQKSLNVNKHPTLTYVAEFVEKGYVLGGELTLNGVTVGMPVGVDVTEEAGGHRITASSFVTQSEFGIKPYSQMMGALQVSDSVQVDLSVLVPAQ